MKITYKDIVNAANGISELLKKSFNAKKSIEIVRVAKVIRAHLDDYNIVKERLLNKFGISENGTDYTFDTVEKKEAYVKELNVLLETTIEIEFKKIELEETDMISGELLMNLYDFISVIGSEN